MRYWEIINETALSPDDINRAAALMRKKAWQDGASDVCHVMHDAGYMKWLLSARVTFDQIDWVQTLAANATPDYADEKEITVLADASIEIDHYQRA